VWHEYSTEAVECGVYVCVEGRGGRGKEPELAALESGGQTFHNRKITDKA